MPNATVRANARPMPEAKPDEYWRHAYFDLEEKIRDVKYMASISAEFICDLELKKQDDDDRIASEMAVNELERLGFVASMASRLADELHEVYLAKCDAAPDKKESANV